MIYEVHYSFGCLEKHDSRDQPYVLTDSFIFTITTQQKPKSWMQAYGLFEDWKEDFCKACLEAGITSDFFHLLSEPDIFIPPSYLHNPVINVTDDSGVKKLLEDAPVSSSLDWA